MRISALAFLLALVPTLAMAQTVDNTASAGSTLIYFNSFAGGKTYKMPISAVEGKTAAENCAALANTLNNNSFAKMIRDAGGVFLATCI